MTIATDSVSLLHQLIAMGSTSLLQYVGESFPYAPESRHAAVETVLGLAHEERDEAARLTRLLQKQRLPTPRKISYPSHFTTINFVSLDYLLPRLIAEHVKEIAAISERLNDVACEDTRKLVQSYLDMKRRHLQTLQDLAGSKPLAPAA